MDSILNAEDVVIGFHPDGYRIDKTASAMTKYTKWEIDADNQWHNCKPVCFHSLPPSGWVAVDKFDNDGESSKINDEADII